MRGTVIWFGGNNDAVYEFFHLPLLPIYVIAHICVGGGDSGGAIFFTMHAYRDVNCSNDTHMGHIKMVSVCVKLTARRESCAFQRQKYAHQTA